MSDFDFDRCCLWVEAEIGRIPAKHGIIEFHRGAPSPKRGAVVDFKTNEKLLQFAFWETGEADFFGLDLRTNEDIVDFLCRLLDDVTFEKTFRDCLSTVTPP